jgi:hypothetical protein
MNRRPLGADRWLMLLASLSLAGFVVVDLVAAARISKARIEAFANGLETAAARGAREPFAAEFAASRPLARDFAPPPPPRGTLFAPSATFTADELAKHAEERERRSRLRGRLAPPLALQAQLRGTEVVLSWEANPGNGVFLELSPESLLTAQYQVHRWRERETPTLLGAVPLAATRFVDETLGPRGGLVHYSLGAILKERIGAVETLIESSPRATVDLEVQDGFEFELLSGDAAKIVLQVTLIRDETRPTSQFEVDNGAQVGSILRLDGQEVDFRTGWKVDALSVEQATIERTRRVPMFNADGSRASGESGFLFRDDVRTVPVRRLIARLSDDRGNVRELTRDDEIR